MGRLASWGYLATGLATGFFVVAAVGLVTAAFLDALLGISATAGTASTTWVAVGLFVATTALLLVGKFNTLDKLVKFLASVLVLSTVVAVVLSVASPPEALPAVEWPEWDLDTAAGAAFLIALMGWMPTAVDLSTWNSIWTLERIETSGYRPTLRETLREFNLGYGVSALLAFGFLTLGALLLHRTGASLPSGSAGFAAGIVGLYAKSIGPWSAPIMGAAAFSAMLGTCIAVMDGYARSLSQSLAVALGREASARWGQVALLTVSAGGLAIVVMFSGQIKQLVDLATTLSFLVAPLVAFWNLRLVTRSDFPVDARPGRGLQAWAWAGLAFLTAFTLWFLWIQFVA